MNKLPGELNRTGGLYFPLADRPLPMPESTNQSVMMIPRYLTGPELEFQNRYQWGLYQAYCQGLYAPLSNMPLSGSLPFRNTSGSGLPRFNMYPPQVYSSSGYSFAPQPAQGQVFVATTNSAASPSVTVPQKDTPRPQSQQVQATAPRIPIKLDFSKVPVPPPKPIKKEKPEVIVLEDSDPVVALDESNKLPQAAAIAPAPKTIPIEPPHKTMGVRDVTHPLKEERSEKSLESDSKREKQVTVPATGKKSSGRTVVKTLVVEEGKNDTSLRIRIKKISKGPRPPQPEKPKPQQRTLRERRPVVSDWPKLPRYYESPGKIRSGSDHQTQLPEFLLNQPKFQAQKEQKRLQLEARRVWNKTQHQTLYVKLRTMLPTVPPERLITFIKERHPKEIEAMITQHEVEIRHQLEVEVLAAKEPMACEQSTPTRADCPTLTLKA